MHFVHLLPRFLHSEQQLSRTYLGHTFLVSYTFFSFRHNLRGSILRAVYTRLPSALIYSSLFLLPPVFHFHSSSFTHGRILPPLPRHSFHHHNHQWPPSLPIHVVDCCFLCIWCRTFHRTRYTLMLWFSVSEGHVFSLAKHIILLSLYIYFLSYAFIII